MTFAVRRVEDNVHSEYRGGADSAGAPDQTVPGTPEPRPLEAEVSHIVYAELPVQAPLTPVIRVIHPLGQSAEENLLGGELNREVPRGLVSVMAVRCVVAG